MARQQTQSAKDNDPGGQVGRVRKVVVLFVWERPLDRRAADDGGAF